MCVCAFGTVLASWCCCYFTGSEMALSHSHFIQDKDVWYRTQRFQFKPFFFYFSSIVIIPWYLNLWFKNRVSAKSSLICHRVVEKRLYNRCYLGKWKNSKQDFMKYKSYCAYRMKNDRHLLSKYKCKKCLFSQDSPPLLHMWAAEAHVAVSLPECCV